MNLSVKDKSTTRDLFREMVAVSRLYCGTIEAVSDDDGSWLEQLSGVLPRLHAAVSALGTPPEDMEHPLVPDLDARFELFSRLRTLLGGRDGYWMEFDAADDGQNMSGSLADDLTDIYCELKHGLMTLELSPSSLDSVLDGWRNGFHKHWGQHLVDAERHLYALAARNELRL